MNKEQEREDNGWMLVTAGLVIIFIGFVIIGSTYDPMIEKPATWVSGIVGAFGAGLIFAGASRISGIIEERRENEQNREKKTQKKANRNREIPNGNIQKENKRKRQKKIRRRKRRNSKQINV